MFKEGAQLAKAVFSGALKINKKKSSEGKIKKEQVKQGAEDNYFEPAGENKSGPVLDAWRI